MLTDNRLPDGWRWVTIGELGDPRCRAIVSGPFGSNIGSRFFVDAGVPVIRGNNLTRGGLAFVDSGFVFITPEKASELGNVDAVRDDLVITAAGTLGQIGIIPRDSRHPLYVISNKQIRVRVDHSLVLPLFAYYWLSSATMTAYIEQRNTGSSVPLINLTVTRSLPVPLPPIDEQSLVVETLSSLDDKIEQNRRTGAKLEELARVVFKAWFVDFEPVKAKAGGATAFPGMPPETFAALPNTFQDSPLGPVPEGWAVKPLSDIAEVIMGTSPPSETYNDVGEGHALINGPVEYGDRFPLRVKWTTARVKLAQRGDLIFCVRGSTTGRRVLSDGVYGLGRGVCAIRSTNDAQVFVQTLIENELPRLLAGTTGSVFPSLSAPTIKSFDVVVPSTDAVMAFCAFSEPLTEATNAAACESAKLAALRDYLLPRLLSGRVRVGAVSCSPEKMEVP